MAPKRTRDVIDADMVDEHAEGRSVRAKKRAENACLVLSEKMKELLVCVVCQGDALFSMELFGCGHHRVCLDCADSLRRTASDDGDQVKCPCCRTYYSLMPDAALNIWLADYPQKVECGAMVTAEAFTDHFKECAPCLTFENVRLRQENSHLKSMQKNNQERLRIAQEQEDLREEQRQQREDAQEVRLRDIFYRARQAIDEAAEEEGEVEEDASE